MRSARKKILFLIPCLGGGGAERVFSVLLRHLDRSRFEPHLALLKANGAFLEDIPKDVVIHDLKASRVRYALPSIVRLVWRIKPQTLLSTMAHLNLGLILAKPLLPVGIRLLVRETCVASAILVEEAQHPRLWNWFYRHLYKRANTVVCVSDSMVDDLVEHFGLPREKLVRIYNPVDTQRVREFAEIGENPYYGPGPHLVTAGRMTKAKGFDVLLDAMPTVLECFPTARLAILGEGPLQGELTEQVRRLGLNEIVHFLGFQQNPWPYLKHADLFVLPSRYEGLPNVLLETLTLGTPVVATDCLGATREVQESGARMVLVPPENPAALAEAAVSVCRRGREYQDSMETSRSALSRFDLDRVVEEYAALL
jgi:glycosyltransferase involved in cell wall biosynthesis